MELKPTETFRILHQFLNLVQVIEATVKVIEVGRYDWQRDFPYGFVKAYICNNVGLWESGFSGLIVSCETQEGCYVTVWR